ncbi:uncharacterized protein EI97DRAFT_480612 [Westerdykella ornata]|uniref:HTH La-type RNA-binding domain-containing protein n=1 Tax=Westerdykella ornata TaxID=318751 RepID=A0A6A6JBP6_WESOR|nr:uncharacterized protein EI97DRAFT_480612 [Westerdykella ornata]KAF2273593.1 hypothetical protein EI97DRAFT_480612 [Westerdykella ornata]
MAASSEQQTVIPEAASEPTSVNDSTASRNKTEEPEHPDAPAIRKQVEYYFSDANLRTDKFLLQCCGGRENLPVSLGRICGFKKMRKFPKKVVPVALRRSNFLEVSDDGKRVWRKVPLEGKCLLDEDFKMSESETRKAHDKSRRRIAYPLRLIPQTKKVLPDGMTKKMMLPTGFEPTYAEGPLSPAEAAEDAAMYDEDKPFVERIELAIHQFMAKKRMHEMYSKVFNKWMIFGGVNCEPRQFGGLSQVEMKQMAAEEIARARAIHQVSWDRGDSNKWVVDFVGVAEAFLSSIYPITFGYEAKGVATACRVLRAFYNYLLLHSVCDEYRSQILAARALCDKAETELPQCYAAATALPGAFNVAASTMLGGYHAGANVTDAGWTTDSERAVWDVRGVGMRVIEAEIIFRAGCLVYGNEALRDLVDTESDHDVDAVKPVKTESHLYLEVVKIVSPTKNEEIDYMLHRQSWDGVMEHLNLQPMGKLVSSEYTFLVEEAALKECYPGLKMSVTVITLPGGMHILDEVKETYCSFYKVLPNELLAGRKTPKFRLMNRHLEGLEMAEKVGIDRVEEMEAGTMDDEGYDSDEAD